MNLPIDPALRILSRIVCRRKRIAKWAKEADEVEDSWTGGVDYKKFCEDMAGAAREKEADLEAELRRLQR